MNGNYDRKNTVEVIELTRGDRFYFSRNYHLDGEMQDILAEDADCVERINGFAKGPNTVRRLDALQKLGLWGTAALEGSPVSSGDAVKVLSGERADVDELSRRELLNIREAYADLDGLAASRKPLLISEELIRDKHAVLTDGLAMERNEPGVYRNLDNYPEVHSFEVGSRETGGVYRPPRLLRDIEVLMEALCRWLNAGEMLAEPPLVRAALAHYHLALIHPFWDGNGRLCRLIEAMILAAAGVRYTPRYMLKFYYDEYTRYYRQFRSCEKDRRHDVSPFLQMVVMAHMSAQTAILLEMNVALQEELAERWIADLNDSRVINGRQAKLMHLLVERDDSISIRILRKEFPYNMIFEGVSEDTIRRDLKKLLALGMVSKDGVFYAAVPQFWESPRVAASIVE